jgi:hypothetical protein
MRRLIDVLLGPYCVCGHTQTHSQDCAWKLVVVRASAPHEFGSLVPAARTHTQVKWRANLHREGYCTRTGNV